MSAARRRFRFIKEIAEGGFGKVYLAEQLSADGFSRIVAVKLLHAKWSSHDEIVMRTRDEARLLGLIRHQHIVKVEDLSSIDGKCAIVMEYLEGVDLKYLISFLRERHEPFPRAALFEICLAVASALDAAYNGLPLQGGEPLRVIHRDIKPSNIFVTVAGSVKVLDFGTARANFAEREAKTQALAFGSQGYMAPERMLGEEDTAAADVFSLGVTLCELLSFESFGRIPPRPNKFAAKVQDKLAHLPLEGDPEWQEQVRETLRGMLAYEPEERPTAAQLVDVFELLSQNASDTGLRRFCRTTVAEAKAAEPDMETDDPLTGQVVDEDASSAFGVVAGVPALDGSPPAGGGMVPPPPPPPGTSGPISGPQSVSGPQSGPQVRRATSLPVSTDPGPGVDASEPMPKGGGGMLKVVLGLSVVGLLVVVVGGVGAAVVFFGVMGGTGGTATTTAAANTEVAPEPDGPQGGQVLTRDEREGVARSPTRVSLSNAEAAAVTISSGFGFRAEWDGRGSFDLGEIPEGVYRTMVTPDGGARIRNKTFEVAGGKSCEFSFDVAAQEWEGGCT